MASVFQKPFNITSYELNPGGDARLTTIANYFQEVAYHHAHELGFGYEQMKERCTLWMLSRMKIRMFSYPAWNDRVIVETWPSGIDKLFALRDFRVTNPEGNSLGIATTCWLIVHMDTHRPIRPGAELERFSRIEYGDPVFDSNLEKIELPVGPASLGRHTVVFSDLDIVGHVNNVKYMDWCIDAALTEGLKDQAIMEFEINFLHEALLNNHVVIKGVEEAPGAGRPERSQTMVAFREEDGLELIRARIQWKPASHEKRNLINR
jgi:acyl-ACP thioesterase